MLRFLSEDDYLAAVQDAADDRFLEVAVEWAGLPRQPAEFRS
jgi:hypothetical protein